MLEWAEHQFNLNKPDANGVTKREHLEQVERQLGRNLRELESPVDFPNILANVWTAFCSCGNRRSQGFSGPNPISPLELKSWLDLTNTRLDSREVDLLFSLDVLYLRCVNGK